MTDEQAPEISGGQRVAGVGKTGSGKTHALGLLMLYFPRLLVLDPKGGLSDERRKLEGEYLWNLDDVGTKGGKAAKESIERGGPGRLRVPAPLDGDWEPWCKWAYDQGGLTVYIDEIYGVVDTARPGKWLNALYTRGRGLNIGVWTATQRPAWIPRVMLTESEWIFQFRLSDEEDRDRMKKIIGPAALEVLPPRAFLLYHEAWDAPVKYSGIEQV